jgi:ubiquinone/menaquinone biosynthesis C-methylase UbiE
MSKINGTNFIEITENQKKTWSAGDFNQIARQNVVMAEALCAAVDPRPGQRVLDVACGSGTAALVAERRYCEVAGIDYVPELIERAKLRADANGQEVEFKVGDAQNLPFADDSFDVVISVYGVQFAPDHEKAAKEMLRVCKPGGVIGLAGPIPEGWSGDFFATHAKYMPPPPGVKSPLRWGTDEGLNELLGPGCSSVENTKRKALQYYHSTEHAVEVFKRWFGPTIRATEKLDQYEQQSLFRDLQEVFSRYNRGTDGTAIVENTYMQTIARTNQT